MLKYNLGLFALLALLPVASFVDAGATNWSYTLIFTNGLLKAVQ